MKHCLKKASRLSAKPWIQKGKSLSIHNLNLAIPVAFEAAWMLAALIQANHIAHLCSGPSLVCRRPTSSSVLGIKNQNAQDTMIYMDELETPDSSRIWDKSQAKRSKAPLPNDPKEEIIRVLKNEYALID